MPSKNGRNLLDLQNAIDATYQFRYGVNQDEKTRLADRGLGLGPNSSYSSDDPEAADRATSAYLGTRRWGGAAAPLFMQSMREVLGDYVPAFSDGGRDAEMKNAALLAASRAVADENAGRPSVDTIGADTTASGQGMLDRYNEQNGNAARMQDALVPNHAASKTYRHFCKTFSEETPGELFHF